MLPQNPPSEGLLIKMPLAKRSFLDTIFLENEAKINKNNYRMMFAMSTQVSLPKISSILHKMEIWDTSLSPLNLEQ